jgi:hypothetical protein
MSAAKIHFSTPKTAIGERMRRKSRRVERSLVLPQLRAHADMRDPIADRGIRVDDGQLRLASLTGRKRGDS